MTAWIIGPANTNVNTITGYTAGAGLAFGVGLILGFGGFTGIQFNGGGALFPSTIAAARNSAALAGTGGMFPLPSGQYTTNPATLAGAGSASYLVSLGLADAGTFAGAGTLTGNIAKFIGASFAGSGSLSASAAQGWAATAILAGTGSLSALPSGRFVTNLVTLSGSGLIGSINYL